MQTVETAAEVRAAAEVTAAMDEMWMAQAEMRRVDAEMAERATMADWDQWQVRRAAAKRRVSAAVDRVVRACKAQCRAVAA